MAAFQQEPLSVRVQQCALWDKVKEGNVHLISTDDIQELFFAFNATESIDTHELVRLSVIEGTGLTSEDVKAWIKDSDADGLGEVTIHDVHRGITRGNVAFTLVKKTLFGLEKEHKPTECSLNELLNWLKYEYDKNSNLWSLPETLLLFFAFVAASALHLNVAEAWRISNIMSLVQDAGDFESLFVKDRDTWWDWLQLGWLRNVLRHDIISTFITERPPNQDPLISGPFPGRVLKMHQVVGAIRVRRWFSDPMDCPVSDFWKALYSTCQGGPLKPDDWYIFYHQKREQIEEQIRLYREVAWVDMHTAAVDVQSFTYNAHQAMFTLQNFRFEFATSGFVVQRLGTRESFVDAPYYNLWLALPDLIFLWLLLNILYSEMKEAIPAAMNGLDGVKDYLKFWNVVDWINVFMGIAVVTVWLMFVVKVSGELPSAFVGLPSDALDLAVFTNRSYLTYEEFDGVVNRQEFELQMANLFTVAEETAHSFMIARWLIVIYLFVLMFKFFKAFRANDRLDVVIQTITDSATDVIHFVIAFALVFSCFSCAGMMLFGYTVEGFHTLVSSFFFCWRSSVGMDDIEVYQVWYQALAYFWYFSYLGLMSILMINILVGLIFEAYGRIHANAGEPPTLLEQVSEAVDTLKDTASYLSMWYIICELEDDDFPAHPAQHVTIRSLKKAFSKDRMKKDNAEYLIESASAFAKKQAKNLDLSVSDGVRMIGQTRTNVNKLHALSDQVNEMLRKFHLQHTNGPDQGDWLNQMGGGTTPHAVQQEPPKVADGIASLDPLSAVRPTTSATSGREKKSREELLLERMRGLTTDLIRVNKEQNRLVEHLSQTIGSRQEGIQERDAWGRQKTIVLTDRCEKIEISIGKLGECLKGVDPAQLRSMPEKLKVVAQKLHDLQQEDSSPKEKHADGVDRTKDLAGTLAYIREDVAKISTATKAKVNVPLALMHIEQFVNQVTATSVRKSAANLKALSRATSQAKSLGTSASRSNFSNSSSDIFEEDGA